ncbi:MAG: sigma-54 dependent transcriptional regulator [Myxococcota bacterium]
MSSEDPAFLSAHVLLVEDEALCRRSLERALKRMGCTVSTASAASEALEVVEAGGVDVVLSDLRLPDIDGLELIRRVAALEADLPCIAMTAFGGPLTSIDALRAGAFWYLEKPFDESFAALERLIEQALGQRCPTGRTPAASGEPGVSRGLESIVGKSDALRRSLEMVERVADSDATVLILGESGTGKELVARATHFHSRRAKASFVAVNCGAIPETLLESELFGHVRGAFTSADRQRDGRFAVANGGTIFLDEIAEMSPNLQVKLLRVLQDGTYEQVGSSLTETIDVRTIAATNQNLQAAMREGRFRDDLFYRLNVVPIELPPLRERQDDIPLLIAHFLGHVQARRPCRLQGFTPEAMQELCVYAWPGNVRELESLVERLAILCDRNWVEVEDLPPSFGAASTGSLFQAPRVPESGLSFQKVVGRIESDIIRQALEHTKWNKSKAAQLLGLNRTTLLEMIKKRGLARRAPPPETQ